MSDRVKPQPAGYHSLTPGLTIKGADRAIAFYEKGLGAKVKSRMDGPDGKSVAHAELQIGDSVFMLGEEDPARGTRSPTSLGGTAVSLYVYTPDVDSLYQRAVSAGATSVSAPENMFWGDRSARIRDPFGHEWGLATHIEEVTPKQMETRAREWMAAQADR
jgi:PhnB protein